MNRLHLLCVTLTIIALTALSAGAQASTPEDLNKTSSAALSMLINTNPLASDISKKAKAILIFPNIVKAGFVFGGAYGEGVMMKSNKIEGYYNSVSASFGWLAGAESYSYVVFLMNDSAVKYLHKTNGLEIGIGPSVVVVNEGIAKNLSTTSLKKDAYAFIFDQQGLMASLSIEGTKISHIKKSSKSN
jgi:lipid-binding SYLF domain-containing protein